jgi:hypothetical protein
MLYSRNWGMAEINNSYVDLNLYVEYDVAFNSLKTSGFIALRY